MSGQPDSPNCLTFFNDQACNEHSGRKLQKPRSNKPWQSRKFSGKPAGPRSAPRPHPGRSFGPEDDGPLRLFGIHPVEAALKNPNRRIKGLLLTENAERRLRESMEVIDVPIERVSPRDLDKLLGADAVHQGAAAEAEPLPEPDWDDVIAAAADGPLVVLDQVTDPHNVGAILRSCAAFGAAGLVMTRRHSPPLNGVLAKSASGALELVPVALIANLARALDELKSAGVHVVGLEGKGETTIEETDWSKPTALVMGAEGKGLRDLTKKSCDALARISMSDAIGSLNVSNAAAIALHAALVARTKRA
jgi:23S rRNA (guanosine2251-2'-O)-methyltransferase